MKPTLLEAISSHAEAVNRGWVDPAGTTLGENGSVAGEYENNEGSTLVAGTVVKLQTDGTVATTTTAQSTGIIGVVIDDIDDGELGPVAFFGPVNLVNVTAAVTAGHYAETTTTAGAATGNATPREGSFGIFTSSSASPSAFLFGAAFLTGAVSGGGITGPTFEVTPPQSVPMPPWVKPSGSGVITADPQGRITIDSAANYKAFPGMAFLEGRLHLVYRDGSEHNSSGGVIKYRTSDNLGRTWTSATTIVSPTAGDDLRDPNLTALSSGRLLLTYDYKTPWNGTSITARVRYSDDRGISWSSAYTPPNTIGVNEADVTSPAIELADGTILLPGYGDVGGKYRTWVWVSTDSGLTFPTQTNVASDATLSLNEMTIRQLASGKIVALMREETTGDTYRSVSTDLGATWSAEAMVIDNNVAGRPDFVEIWPGVLLWFGRGTSTASRWAVSWDEGATWTALQETDSGETLDAQYHAPVVLAPGYVAVVYSIENSSTDADLYIRYYYDGYGVDPLGQARFDWLQVDEQAQPSTPPSGKGVFYAGTDSKPYYLNDSGTATDLTAGAPTEAQVRDAGRWEVVVSGTAPPVAVSNPDDDDWVYGWVSG